MRPSVHAVRDYVALDLRAAYDSGLGLLPAGAPRRLGSCQLRGIPFSFGEDEERCVVALRTIVHASQENRQHFLGHLGLLGLTEPVVPWCSDGPPEAELGGSTPP